MGVLEIGDGAYFYGLCDFLVFCGNTFNPAVMILIIAHSPDMTEPISVCSL